MKSSLFVAVLVVSLVAVAETHKDKAGVFTGAYTLTKKSCPELYEDGFRRAYLSVEKTVGAEEISINFYGDDARIESILLGKGERKPLGSPDSAKAKESWTTEFKTPLHVIQTKETKSPRHSWKETAELKLPEGKLNVEYKTSTTAKGEKPLVCNLKPTLRKEEKKDLCKQIAVWGEGAEEDSISKLSEKDCLEGEFAVTENTEGQLGVQYLNSSAIEGNTITCDAGFDKPMGSFHPTVEECTIN